MHLTGQPQPPPGGMRVVILEPDAEIRDALQRTIDKLPGFLVVGQARTWNECESLLNVYLPELLITRIDLTSLALLETAADTLFPVIIGLRPSDSFKHHDSSFDTLDLPLDLKAATFVLEHVRTEIYRRKLDELSGLMQQYMDFSRGLPKYLSSLRVEGHGDSEVPAELVMYIAAYGNYVQVHTGADVHEIRDTLAGMRSRLDPTQFARVHRSFLVNRKHVHSIVRKDGAAMSVLLSNGIEIPVGPNYRAEVDGFEAITNRLSA
jgi:two-component system LytT family response regulator